MTLATVHITMRRQPFKKGYVGNWSEEIFEIDARLPTVPVTYRLKDLVGDTIKGKFYEPEIQKVDKSDEDYFDVEKILKNIYNCLLYTSPSPRD